MIITKLMGGLGNQMFQYAAGKSLSVKYSVPLKLDTIFLMDRTPRENFTYRNFDLNSFNINAELASSREVKKYTRTGLLDRIKKRLISTPKRNELHYLENGFPYNTEFENLPSDIYIEGYWQTEKYFRNIRSVLLNEFEAKSLPSSQNRDLKNKISSSTSVSVHIRRGDYISNQVINQYHGACNIEYYRKAIEIVCSRLTNPVFFFFSDDIEWVKSSFSDLANECFFVSHNIGSESYNDILLMRTCKHNIIANSSFSWWGAWLNLNPDKLVIAPEKWFSDSSINTIDIIPDSWTKIS